MIRGGGREIERRSRTPAALAVALTLWLLAALALAQPADARIAYTEAKALSARGEGGYAQSIFGLNAAIDGTDRSTVAWVRDEQLELVRIAADGTPGPVQVLADSVGSGAALAVDGRGRATVVWAGREGSDYVLKAIQVEPDGSVGPVIDLSDPPADVFGADVALDESGAATIVWGSYDYSGTDPHRTVEMARIAADGTPSPAQTISEYAGYTPKVAVGPSGAAMVVWSREARLLASWVSPSGTPGKLMTLAGGDGYPNFTGADVVADSAGRFTLAWGAGHPERTMHLLSVGADGTEGDARVIPTNPDDPVSTPQLLVDPADRITALWAACVNDDCYGRFAEPRFRIFTSKLDGSGAPGAVVPIPGRTTASEYAAVGSSGHIAVAWPRYGSAGIDAVRLRPDGSPGPVVPASRPALVATSSPRVTVSSTGTATVTWINTERDRVQFSRSYRDGRLQGSAFAKRRQHQRRRKVRIRVKVRAGEKLTALARGKLKLKRRDYSIKRKKARLGANTKTTLRLRPNWRDHRIAERIQDGEKVVAKVTLALRDHAGNVKERKFRVRLVR